MIFVTVGTTKFPFFRMSQLVYNLSTQISSDQKIVFQHGSTSIDWKANNVELCGMLSFEEFTHHLEKTTIIISHGGPATIYLAHKYHKIPFVLPRESKYKEHINDHQLFYCKFLSQEKKATLITDDHDFKKEFFLKRNKSEMVTETSQKERLIRFLNQKVPH